MALITDDVYTTTIRLIVAAFLSGLVGMEREMKNHPAGLRTHILVGVGSCLMMLLSIFGFDSFFEQHQHTNGFDPSRLPAYVVSGIGFLGAGTIMVNSDRTVKGLTTAASIWVVAGLGLVVGIGMYYEAILTTIIMISILFFLSRLENAVKVKQKRDGIFSLSVLVNKREGILSLIASELEKYGIEILELTSEEQNSFIQYSFLLKSGLSTNQVEFVEKLQSLIHVHKVLINQN